MVLEISTPALVFPAVSLLILAYSQRFASLSRMIRKFSEEKKAHDSDLLDAQLRNFHRRIHLVQRTEAFGVVGLIMSMFSSLALFGQFEFLGMTAFVMSISFILLSLFFALWEVMLSTEALHVLVARQAPKGHQVKQVFARLRGR